MSTINIKLGFSGVSHVGKTSLLNRLIDNTFSQQTLMTIGVEMKTKIYHISNQKIKVNFFDKSTKDPNMLFSNINFKYADAILLFFNITDKNSLKKLEQQIQKINTAYNYPANQTYLIGCKSDLQHEISAEVIDQFQKSHKYYNYFETSAKQNICVLQCFNKIIEDCVKRQQERILKGLPKEGYPVKDPTIFKLKSKDFSNCNKINKRQQKGQINDRLTRYFWS